MKNLEQIQKNQTTFEKKEMFTLRNEKSILMIEVSIPISPQNMFILLGAIN